MSTHDDRPILILSRAPWHARSLLRLSRLAHLPARLATDKPRASASSNAKASVRRLPRLDQRDPDGAARAIDEAANAVSASLVVGADTGLTRVMVHCAPSLETPRFPMPSPDLFEQLANKASFARLLHELALPSPRTQVVRSLDSLHHIDPRRPLVVKPDWGESGQLVRVTSNQSQLRPAVEACLEAGRDAIIQEYVPGHDIDLSLLADRGTIVAWTIQKRTRRGLRFVKRRDVLQLGAALCEATEYHGVAHLDMRIDSRTRKPVFIECNPRFWGTVTASAGAGVNFLDLAVRLATNRLDPDQAPQTARRRLGIFRSAPRPTGRRRP